MRLPALIAFRYLFSRKSTNVINIISGISVFGVLFCTAALVILLSAFNGLESWVVRLYDSFDQDLKITSRSGKFFSQDQLSEKDLASIEGVALVAPYIEENALLTYRDAQYIATVKGVGASYTKMSGIDSMMVDGNFSLYRGGAPSAVLGAGIAYSLSLSLRDIINPLTIYVPRPGASVSLNPADAFNSAAVFPSGVFEIQPEFDTKYVIVPIEFARELLQREDELLGYEVQLKNKSVTAGVAAKIREIAGPGFEVKDRFQQHEVLYKIINSEKWAVYLIGAFILLIAVFNITGSLTMLIVDKRRDIRTLQSLGAGWTLIRRIFFLEGLAISVIGLIGGLITGLVVIWMQLQFDLVLINDVDPYPMEVQVKDILVIIATVLAIGSLAAWFPARQVLKRQGLDS